jgi:RND family efflux transporter MFP subunit
VTRALALGIALAALVGCRSERQGSAAAETPPDEGGARVGTARAATQRFSQVVTAIGTVTPRPGHFAELAAPAPTRVARIRAAVGDRVAQGDTVLEFEREPFDAAAQSAATALANAEHAYARAVRLVQAGILPQKDSDQAAADLAQAQVAAVTARRAQQLATLRTPIAGVVTRMSAVLGAPADQSQPLVEVADPTTLDILFGVSPADAAQIRDGDTVTVAGSGGDAPLGQGRVTGVAAALDSASRAVTVRAELRRPTRPLRIGESVVGRIVIAVHAQAVTVPLPALVPNGDGFQVFVVDSGGVAHTRAVRVGARSDSVAEVVSGLAPGETVVTAGAYGIQDGAKILQTVRTPE